MDKKVLLIISVLIITVLGIFFVSFSNKESISSVMRKVNPQTQIRFQVIDINASFAIFTNGTFRVFTAPMYHNLSQDVFIKSSNPNIVHVKKSAVTWDDFFKTLPFSLSTDCLTTGTGQTFCTNSSQALKFYINGQKDTNALERIIKNGDQLLVSYGSESDAQIKSQLDQIPYP